jgi:hypothetical protein
MENQWFDINVDKRLLILNLVILLSAKSGAKEMGLTFINLEVPDFIERETGVEPATLSLGS